MGKVVAIVALILALLVPAGYMVGKLMSARDVPDVIGLKLDEAENKLERKNLIYDVIYVTDEKVEKDVVIDQNPAGETPAHEGDKVILMISSGPEQIIVPDLIFMKAEDAIVQLTDRGIKFTQQFKPSKEDVGTVIGQDPVSGEPITKEDTVTLIISGGSVNIPNLEGKTLEEAEKILKENRLILQLPLNPENISEKDQGELIGHGLIKSTSPEAGNEVTENYYVKLTIYQDPSKVIHIPIVYEVPKNEETLKVRITMRAEGSDTEVYQSTTYEIEPDAVDRKIITTINIPDDRTYYAYVYINDRITDENGVRLFRTDSDELLSLNKEE